MAHTSFLAIFFLLLWKLFSYFHIFSLSPPHRGVKKKFANFNEHSYTPLFTAFSIHFEVAILSIKGYNVKIKFTKLRKIRKKWPR
ncbi:MAG: hypothetical protein AMS15_09750 [Planctomycetes bacterium DG_23]|nr:MAG: hypothetical protein AMS15_09750 [Planctomycetes bacterium DG_23]